MSKEFGDFQTPRLLVQAVLDMLASRNQQWTHVLEPTCGQGNFITGILNDSRFHSVKNIAGVELQASHLETARHAAAKFQLSHHTNFVHASIFDVDLSTVMTWRDNAKLLVIGNPPWVTNAELSTLSSENLPQKRNIKRLPGIAALTGEANFDIAESILLKLIFELQALRPTIAMLVKTNVARNVIKFAADRALPVCNAAIYAIDSRKWFNAAVDACLFSFDIASVCDLSRINVFETLDDMVPSAVMGIRDGHLIGNVDDYHALQFLEGKSHVVWRQGVKHDAASVMELTKDAGENWVNRQGESVHIEPAYLYPLVKSSDLFHYGATKVRHGVIITQRSIGENTLRLASDAPQLWQYLQQHTAIFLKRKSSIYQNKPPFSIFGIGDYTFAPYKVAVSGLHKQIRFHAVGQYENKPIVFDDTCYFLPCYSPVEAALYTIMLNHPACIRFITTISFQDSKRPITKALLQRINLGSVYDHIDRTELIPEVSRVVQQIEPQFPNLEAVITQDKLERWVHPQIISQPTLF